MSPARIDRRHFLAAGAVVAGVSAAGLPLSTRPAGATAPTASAEVIDLGVAMTSINTRYAAAGSLPDGTPVIHAVSQGSPTTFNVVDALDGTQLDTHTFTDATSATEIVLSPDQRKVYFGLSGGGHGFLYEYDVANREVSLLATDPAGQRMTRRIVVGPDGVVYGSTYPDAKVYSCDPATGEVHDYGPMTDDGDYAWGFELVNDKLWVGTGIGNAHLFTLDPATGQQTELALPAHASHATLIHKIAHRGDLVIGVFNPSTAGTNTIVYDLTTDQWMSEDSLGVMGLNGAMTPMTSEGVFYYQRFDGTAEICSFDPATLTSTATGWADTTVGRDRTGLQNMGLVEIGQPEAARPILTGMLTTGRHWLFDPVNGDTTTVDADIVGAPIAVHTLAVGPHDNVYTGAHLSSGVMGMINTSTDTVTQLSGPSQADSVTSLQDRIIVGTYPGAEVHVGDVDQPWAWGTNPASLFELGRTTEHAQDRPRALVPAGDQVAMATVPNYGELGGALTLFSLDGEFTVHRHVVTDQSIVSLAHHDGMLVGGTSIDGGLSSTPTATDAEVFIWDVATSQVVLHAVPAPGARSIGALCRADGDRIWGLSDTGTLFELDPVKRRIIRTVDGAPETGTAWGSSTFLQFRKQDGLLYGANGARMFVFDPRTEAMTWNMDRLVGRLVVTAAGRIYFSKDTHVYRYLPGSNGRR